MKSSQGDAEAVVKLAALCSAGDVVDVVFDREQNLYRSTTSSDLYK
jgi:hypothetical protein